MATEKVTGMLLQNLDENTNTENENTENDSQKIWPKERILRVLGIQRRIEGCCNIQDGALCDNS